MGGGAATGGTPDGRGWLVVVRMDEPMHTDNWKPGHWRPERDYHRKLRGQGYNAFLAAGIPAGRARLRVEPRLHFPVHRRRDPANYQAHVIKPLIDALCPQRLVRVGTGRRIEIGLGVIPDDNPQHLDLRQPTIHPQTCNSRRFPFGLVELHVTDLSEETS